jgi:hypothetical protein
VTTSAKRAVKFTSLGGDGLIWKPTHYTNLRNRFRGLSNKANARECMPERSELIVRQRTLAVETPLAMTCSKMYVRTMADYWRGTV